MIRLKTAYYAAVILWIILLISNGTNVRVRDDLDTSIDYWVVVRLLVSCLCFPVSYILLQYSSNKIGIGSRLLLAYAICAILSAFSSHYHSMVLGYAFVLISCILLTIAMIAVSSSRASINRLEYIWASVVLILVIKDSVASIINPDDTGRLGSMDNYNALSFYAAIVFAVVFWHESRHKIGKTAILIILAAVILLTRSRTPVIALLCGLLISAYYFLRFKGPVLKYVYVFAAMSLIFLSLYLYLIHFQPVIDVITAFNRNQTGSEIRSLTGRYQIWQIALHETVSDPIQFLLGHGYGISRLILMKPALSSIGYIPTHAHNQYLELLLAMGIPGLVICISLIGYNFKWFYFCWNRSSEATSYYLYRKITIDTMIFIACFSEQFLSSRLNPVFMLFAVYSIALDHYKSH